ncbi:MAG: serine protease [Anaerolineales bacterium]|nr:serine protease [Anaerolineales bacterium]
MDSVTGIARILDTSGQTVGTGFVLTSDGLIATCAHVIADAGTGPGETVNIVFHCTGEERQAVVEADWWRESDAEDVAILRLIGELPEPVKPLPLGASTSAANHLFETIGFPPTNPTGGILGRGMILGRTKINEMPVLQLRSQEVTGGFSGAPVWDCTTRRVVGMVTATADPDDRWRLSETAFITPAETLRAVCPALQLPDLCPYRSLEAFTEVDAEFFFGRERVVERLVESLRREPRFLAVLGPSGSGKSSLVQAGLIPHLSRGAVPSSNRWEVMVVRPADQPFHQLAAQGLTGGPEDLAGAVQSWLDSHPDRERLVVVLDQFEELLVTGPEEVRRAFLAQLTTLLEAALPVTLVLVLRDDFYSRFAQEVPALLLWLERGLVNVPPLLARVEVQHIIKGPARAVGLTFEAGLVEDVLKDALESASAGEGQVGRSTILPLLEFALTQLWERRRDGVLTHEAYETIGGVTGGLTQWADRAYYGLEQEQQQLARRVLTDLVHLGDESQGLPDSRRRRLLGSLYRAESDQKTVHRVVRQLANTRLLVTGRDSERGQETVELIHDALLREWALLQSWLKEDRRFLAWRQALEGWLRAWVESAPEILSRRDSGRLLRGRDLAEAEQWVAERKDDLNATEKLFIEQSISLRTERESQERRAKRFRFGALGAIVLLFIAFYYNH